MKTLIKNGNLYAKIPLAELTKRNRMELRAAKGKMYVDLDNISGMSSLQNRLGKLADSHNDKVSQMIDKFAKEHASETDMSSKQLADYIVNQLHENYMVG